MMVDDEDAEAMENMGIAGDSCISQCRVIARP
jgi:hypothetical protein